MFESILEYLKSTYKPTVIILHGSRARGKEREGSDWDFIFLYNSHNEIRSGREMFNGQNIEFSSYILPVDDIDSLLPKLQGAKVVYEESNEGTILLEKINAIYAEGVHWSPDKLSNHKLWFEGRVNGMRDSVNNPIIFTKYFADLYQRVFNYWYWIIRNKYSQPIYIAEEEIMNKDLEYYQLVSSLVDLSTKPEEKVRIAEKIKVRLFYRKLD